NVRDMRVAKIKHRMEARVIVKGGEQTESDGNNQKVNEDARFFAGLLAQRFQVRRVGSNSSHQKINEDGKAKSQLGTVANRESEKCSGQKRSKLNENKIQSGYLAEHGKAKGQLPRAAEAEIAPGPGSKNGRQ